MARISIGRRALAGKAAAAAPAPAPAPAAKAAKRGRPRKPRVGPMRIGAGIKRNAARTTKGQAHRGRPRTRANGSKATYKASTKQPGRVSLRSKIHGKTYTKQVKSAPAAAPAKVAKPAAAKRSAARNGLSSGFSRGRGGPKGPMAAQHKEAIGAAVRRAWSTGKKKDGTVSKFAAKKQNAKAKAPTGGKRGRPKNPKYGQKYTSGKKAGQTRRVNIARGKVRNAARTAAGVKRRGRLDSQHPRKRGIKGAGNVMSHRTPVRVKVRRPSFRK